MRYWALLILAVAVPAAAAGPLRQTPPLAHVLDRYARGDFREAVDAITNGQDPAVTARDIRTQAPEWIKGTGSADVARRRLVVATVVLEVAHTGVVTARTRPFAEFWGKWGVQRALIEWACALLRSSAPPQPAERVWHRAALDILEHVGDYPAIAGLPRDTSPDRAVSLQAAHREALGHGFHAQSRFPDDARVALKLVEAREGTHLAGWRLMRRLEVSPGEFKRLEAQAAANRLRRSTGRRDGTSFRTPDDARADDEVRVLSRLLKAAKELIALYGRNEIRADVSLHLGAINLCFADRRLALEHFAAIENGTTDPYLRYMGRFLTGRIHELDRRGDDAETAYRAALEIVPSAQSATASLASLLFTTNRRAEAAALVERGLTVSSDVPDPWMDFQRGGPERWNELIVELRKSFQ
jgi:hypothetical protein